MRVDMLTLYAFSDKAHAKQRELWRGFLALVMPILLECEASEFERILENAQCRSIESMLSSLEAPENPSQLMWSVSGTFAEVLGFEAELGLSAFLDVSLPTRMHGVRASLPEQKDQAIITHWLKAFREVQQRPEFLEITAEWKRAFDVFLETDSGEDEDSQDEDFVEDSQEEIGVEDTQDAPTRRKKTPRSA